MTALSAVEIARLKRERKQAKRLEVPEPSSFERKMNSPCADCYHLISEHSYGFWAGCNHEGCFCRRGHGMRRKERKQKHGH